jgi:hypothetical protein
LGLLGLAALRGRIVHALALLSVEDGPHEDHVLFEDRWMVASLCDE